MKNIIIVEAISTGYNYVEDVVRRGYHPIVLETRKVITDDIQKMYEIYDSFYHQPDIIKECETFEETLKMVAAYHPVQIVAGSEDGVRLCNRLAAALGLPGNPLESLDAMTRKDAMHEALRAAGIRYIRGRKVKSAKEALAFCRENGFSCAVIKPLQSAGSQGLFLCDDLEEVENAARTLLNMKDLFGRPITEILVQERVFGTEYIVNTISSRGRTRLNSILRYEKKKTEEGGFIYDYIEFLRDLEAGHNRLVEYAFQVADALRFQNGIIHGEYMIDEKGPVLIEVNCRPMGCTMPSEYLDLIFGQHETDSTLDALLYPDSFEEAFSKPYRPLRKAYLKLIMVPEDMEAENHPIFVVAKQLRSTYKICAYSFGTPVRYRKTRDLETNGGIIFMVHDNEEVVKNDLQILREIEQKYFKLFLNDGMSRRWIPDAHTEAPDFKGLIKEYGYRGAVLVAADEEQEIRGAQCVTPDTLSDAHKGFDTVIIGYQKALLSLNESECLSLMFDTMDLVKCGGKVIIPHASYRYLSYEREGAEILMQTKGFRIEAPKNGDRQMVTGIYESL